MMLVTALTVALLWGVMPIAFKHVMSRGPASATPRVVLLISAATTGLAACAYALAARQGLGRELRDVPARSVLIVAATALATLFFAQWVYLRLLQERQSYVVTALTYSSPVFTLLLAAVLLGEKVSFLGAAGVLLIVAGVLCLGFAS